MSQFRAICVAPAGVWLGPVFALLYLVSLITPLARALRPLGPSVLAATIALVAGCLIDVNFEPEPFRCSVEQSSCPPNMFCDGTVRQPQDDAGTDATSVDAGVDALASCGDGLCTETCGSCAEDCGICVAGQRLYLTGDGVDSVDASGSGHEVTELRVTRVDSPHGRAYSFNDTDAAVSVIDALDLKTANFAAAAFIRSTAITPGGQDVVSMGDNWVLRIVADGNLRVFAWDGVAYDLCQSEAVNVLDGAWHHVAGHKSGIEFKLFVDGVVVKTCEMLGDIEYDKGDDFTVGQHGTGQTFYRFTGDIDEVRIFDRGLSDNEVANFAGF